MKVVTSVTVFKTSVGQRIGITHSELDDAGNVTKENVKTSKVILTSDTETQAIIDSLVAKAQEVVEGE